MSDINVQLKEGAAVPMPASSTVAEALKKLDRDLAKQALAAKIGGREVDLTAPLEKIQNGQTSVEIEPIVPQTRDGLEVLRHSTAHLLAAAVLDLFPGTKLGIGPALLDDPRYGFFYDVIAPRPLTEADLPVIEKRMRQIASQNLSYRRDEISKTDALRIFADRDAITVLNNERFVRGTDIQKIFSELHVDEPAHAFYLGKELARASLAVTLGKTYRQEGALTWGYLTPPDEVKSEHVRLTQKPAR